MNAALLGGSPPCKPGMPAGQALSILESMANRDGKLDPDLTARALASRCWEEIEEEPQ